MPSAQNISNKATIKPHTKMADYTEGNKIPVRKLISDTDEKYERFEEHWKYGFKKDGVIVIPAEYDDAWYFSEGVAAVERLYVGLYRHRRQHRRPV